MTLALYTLTLPPNVIDLQSVDLDADGQTEILVVTKDSLSAVPAPLSAHIFVQQQNQWTLRQTISLGHKAMFWEAENGLWALDGQGVLDLAHNRRVVSTATWLEALQQTSPKNADIVHDLDGDGSVDFLVHTLEGVGLYAEDGTERWRAPVVIDGTIRTYTKTGGIQFEVAQRAKPMVIRDWDGDGLKDIWFLQGNEATIVTSTTTHPQTSLVELPINVEPQYTTKPKKELNWVRYEDLNQDGYTDIIWQYWVRGDSWFGSTTEIGYALSNGTTFEPAQTIRRDTAILDVQLKDLDGDQSLDLWIVSTDVGVSSLSRALLTQQASAEITVYPFQTQTFSSTPSMSLSLNIPIGQDDAFDYISIPDVNGDTRKDLLVMVDTEVRLYTSHATTWKVESTIPKIPRGKFQLQKNKEQQPIFPVWTEGSTTTSIISVIKQ